MSHGRALPEPRFQPGLLPAAPPESGLLASFTPAAAPFPLRAPFPPLYVPRRPRAVVPHPRGRCRRARCSPGHRHGGRQWMEPTDGAHLPSLCEEQGSSPALLPSARGGPRSQIPAGGNAVAQQPAEHRSVGAGGSESWSTAPRHSFLLQQPIHPGMVHAARTGPAPCEHPPTAPTRGATLGSAHPSPCAQGMARLREAGPTGPRCPATKGRLSVLMFRDTARHESQRFGFSRPVLSQGNEKANSPQSTQSLMPPAQRSQRFSKSLSLFSPEGAAHQSEKKSQLWSTNAVIGKMDFKCEVT